MELIILNSNWYYWTSHEISWSEECIHNSPGDGWCSYLGPATAAMSWEHRSSLSSAFLAVWLSQTFVWLLSPKLQRQPRTGLAAVAERPAGWDSVLSPACPVPQQDSAPAGASPARWSWGGYQGTLMICSEIPQARRSRRLKGECAVNQGRCCNVVTLRSGNMSCGKSWLHGTSLITGQRTFPLRSFFVTGAAWRLCNLDWQAVHKRLRLVDQIQISVRAWNKD